MKIGYFADGPWSHLALEKLTQDKRLEVAFIVPRFDTQDPVLKEWANKLGVDYLLLENVNSQDSLDSLSLYWADLFISMSFNQILRPGILSLPPMGFINCHAGELPFYRGRNILNWALINDAKQFGVTVHYVDEGIDTGDIIEQAIEPITDTDTYATLLDRAIVLCADVLYIAVCKLLEGNAERTVQSEIHPVGFYCGRRGVGDEWIDWNWSSRRIFNFVRSIATPGPCAQTNLDDIVVTINRVSEILNAPEYIGTPGEVVGVINGDLIVKTGDSTIRIHDYKLNIPPRESVRQQPKLRIGIRLGHNINLLIKSLTERVIKLEQQLSQAGDIAVSSTTQD